MWSQGVAHPHRQPRDRPALCFDMAWPWWPRAQLHGTLTPERLQVQLVGRVETFKQDSQLDVVWKMYRVRSLVVSITAV